MTFVEEHINDRHHGMGRAVRSNVVGNINAASLTVDVSSVMVSLVAKAARRSALPDAGLAGITPLVPSVSTVAGKSHEKRFSLATNGGANIVSVGVVVPVWEILVGPR